MQGLLTVFLETSAARGEWQAALNSFFSLSDSSQRTAAHAALVAQALSQGGQWVRSLDFCREHFHPASPYRFPQRAAMLGYAASVEGYLNAASLNHRNTLLDAPHALDSTTGAPAGIMGSSDWEGALFIVRAGCEYVQKYSKQESNKDHSPGEGDGVAFRRGDVAPFFSLCRRHVLPRVPPSVAVRLEMGWREIESALAEDPPGEEEEDREAMCVHAESPHEIKAEIKAGTGAGAGASPCGRTPHPTQPLFGASHPLDHEGATARKTDRKADIVQSSASKVDPREAHLYRILRQPKTRNAWLDALREFQSIEKPSPACFQAVLQCLARQGKGAEAERLVKRYCVCDHSSSPAMIRPSRRLVQTIVDCATRMHSVPLCKLVLAEPSLSLHLTPTSASAAVLLLSTPLVARQEWGLVYQWWDTQKKTPSRTPQNGGNFSDDAEPGFCIRQHLKLSSFVATCVVRGSEGRAWEAGLACFTDSAGSQPDLALLYQLRLLRVAGRWEQAVQLFGEHLSKRERRTSLLPDDHDQEEVLEKCHSILVKENSHKWVPNGGVERAEQLWKNNNNRVLLPNH